MATAAITIVLLISASLLVLLHLSLMRFNNRKYVNKLIDKNHELEMINKKLVESETNLKKLNATKDRLFSIIAHDLRSPFNSILGLSEVLSHNSDKMKKENFLKYMGMINLSAKNLCCQLDNLLEWSRTQTNNIKYKPEFLDLRLLTLNVFTLFELTAYQKKIDLICDINQSTLVFADIDTITAVLRNLTDNAIKFTKEGGQIIVSSKKNENFVEVSVKDSGIGMTGEDVNKLFNIDTAYTRRGTCDEHGSGLGLLMCREFTEMNGGKIWVKSEENVGSTFSFTVPVKNFKLN
jgi:two-component system, sensor histidine kinase and response regulator